MISLKIFALLALLTACGAFSFRSPVSMTAIRHSHLPRVGDNFPERSPTSNPTPTCLFSSTTSTNVPMMTVPQISRLSSIYRTTLCRLFIASMCLTLPLALLPTKILRTLRLIGVRRKEVSVAERMLFGGFLNIFSSSA